MLPVKYFTNEEVADLLTVPECVELVEDLFKNFDDTQMPPKVYMNVPNGDFRAMPAVVGNTAGIKWAGLNIKEAGKINIFAMVMINDIETGDLLAVLDAEMLTAIRTAAVTGVATRYLSPSYATTAAFVGCGHQTLRQIQAVLAVRDIETVKLFDLSEKRANSIKETLEYDTDYYQSQGVAIEVCKSLQECLWDSDIVTTLTPSRKPFIKYKDLKPIVHINAVGADAEGKRELHQCVLDQVDLVAYDEWVQCSHSGEIQYAKKSKISQIWSPISEIVQGRVEISGAARTLFDATGLAIEDVATARYIYEKFNKK